MIGNEIARKLEFYKDNNKLVHIRINSDRFYNGKILLIDLKKNILVLIDAKIGEVPILFEEINRVEPFREAGE